MPNTEDNVNRKLITSITIDGLDYELIHVPKEITQAFKNHGKNIKDIKFETTIKEIMDTIHTGGQVEDKLVFMVKNKIKNA